MKLLQYTFKNGQAQDIERSYAGVVQTMNNFEYYDAYEKKFFCECTTNKSNVYQQMVCTIRTANNVAHKSWETYWVEGYYVDQIGSNLDSEAKESVDYNSSYRS